MSENITTSANITAAAASSILSSLTGGSPLLYSKCSVQGERKYMEDEYFVEPGGAFAAVFDGHGGARYIYVVYHIYLSFTLVFLQCNLQHLFICF